MEAIGGDRCDVAEKPVNRNRPHANKFYDVELYSYGFRTTRSLPANRPPNVDGDERVPRRAPARPNRIIVESRASPIRTTDVRSVTRAPPFLQRPPTTADVAVRPHGRRHFRSARPRRSRLSEISSRSSRRAPTWAELRVSAPRSASPGRRRRGRPVLSGTKPKISGQ